MHTISDLTGAARYTAASNIDREHSLEFLAFRLRNEEYGIDAKKVRELRRFKAVTRIENAPDYFMGIVNLGGSIVPVIDLRIKLHFRKPDYDQSTTVVIVNACNRLIGMVVDSVSSVFALDIEQIMPVLEMNSAFEVNYVIGVYASMHRLVTLVDIDRWMSYYETRLIERYAA